MDCERLHQLDELFKHYPAEVSEEEVLQYRRLVARAEIRELAQANVILCSPVTMATSSLLSALCIQQVSQVHYTKKKILFVSCNGLNRNRVGRSVKKKKNCIIFLV